MFTPTALLVMTHNVTGLKYFCKTTRIDRLRWYKGSGVAWRKHLSENGAEITTGVFGFYTDELRCLDAAKKFSQENNIVASSEWANLVEELGRNGASMKGERNPFFGKKHTPEAIESARQKKLGKSVNKGAYRSPKQRAHLSSLFKGKKNPLVSAALLGRKLSDETKAKISEAGKNRFCSDETREKIRQASLVQWAEVRKLKQIEADA